MLKYKKLTRKYINLSLNINEEILINKKITHHLLNVLRLKNESFIRIFDNAQEEFLAKIHLTQSKSVKLKILHSLRKKHSFKKFKTYLALSLISKKKFLLAIDYAVQLNIDEIFPIISSRSQIQYIHEETIKERIINSTEQSERLNLTKLHPIQKIDDFLKMNFTKIVFLNEKEKTLISQQLIKCNQNLLILTGPEGGFSKEEEENIKKLQNVTSVSLGQNTLTSELAVASALSYINLMEQN